MTPAPSIVLTIAGFDPSSGAGITADLAVFAAHGLFGTSCITALTVQNTLGVSAAHPVASEVVRATLESLQADLPPAGIKIGMLATAEVVTAVADFLESLGPSRPIVVLDPVLRSTSGKALLDEAGVEILRSRLLPLVDWITPNIDELAVLSERGVKDQDDMLTAAQKLHDRFRQLGLLVTGGHLEKPDDLLLPSHANEEIWLPGERIETTSTHGTGCALSSAFLSRLVTGHYPFEAATQAKHYVTEAIRRATPIGHGHGPLHLLWPLEPAGAADRQSTRRDIPNLGR